MTRRTQPLPPGWPTIRRRILTRDKTCQLAYPHCTTTLPMHDGSDLATTVHARLQLQRLRRTRRILPHTHPHRQMPPMYRHQ